MSEYLAGSLVQVQATFTDPATDDPINPSTVTLYFEDGVGTITVEVYGEGDDDFISNPSEGVFTANLDTTFPVVDDVTTNNSGVWTYQYVGTGAVGQAIKASTFVVKPAPIPL
jgi:hypothetical protein